MAPFAVKAILFDLDGTLIDSVPDLHVATNNMLQALDLVPVKQEQVAGWVGNGSLTLVERTLTFFQQSSDPVSLNAAHDIFLEAYSATNNQYSVLFEGVIETLEAFKKRGLRMGLVTNKPARFTPELLEQFGLSTFFEVVLSGDSLPEKKPSAMPLLHAIKTLDVDVQDCLMVGDSASDIAAAKACGMANVLMTYGYHQGLKLEDMGADRMLDHFRDLQDIVV